MLDQVLWFVARGAGAVSLLMLTASACLGFVTITRSVAAGRPRLFHPGLHRRVSLLSVAFLAAMRILPRGTIARTGTPARPGSGNGD